ncbi:undecaprenyl-diphosphate phosphatase [Virgibacillus sp. 179-BFC.A HS]|uniref:Undecaprenyl-diphosphatase n=1 Tax=Tigheibacillus jepli TaxID=3035914 RepID=A0ABU5CIQ4_9BACI|nr:undecaprenyl-diphosphate phosphatase [Virgibacillus sp. 179-BFC.A HS]MDY0406186.1 undecaprenyl-diphosphate phosphatase [Virgibacillus sp. 179-BFC.A HS]
MDALTNFFTLLKYIVLGFIQGFTEPIPISSSGHLIIFRDIFHVEIHGLSFEVLVHLGSLLAIIIIYRKDIIRLAKNSGSFLIKREEKAKQDFLFVFYLVIATLPAGIFGFLLEDKIGDISRPSTVGITLLITCIALWTIRNLRGKKMDGDIRLKDAIIVGLAQTVALIPGISRSGATLVAAMLLGMKQETALRFSFMLYIPVSLGAGILSFSDILHDKNFDWIPGIVAFIVAFIASYFALKWFMGIMARGNLKYFAYYCFAAGILVLLFL